MRTGLGGGGDHHRHQVEAILKAAHNSATIELEPRQPSTPGLAVKAQQWTQVTNVEDIKPLRYVGG